ncbi:MAG TPA: hypothetical protein VEY08_02585 [Chloroflexia bacterium]|nr:hypothetical protein [Chloroflexia bacterium]
MARFQGNTHAGSDRLAATLLVLVLLIVIGFVFWDFSDPNGFRIFWGNLADAFNIRR